MALVSLPRQLLVDANGTPRVGAKLYFYQSGTTTAITVYTTSAYSVAHTQPVETTSSGIAPAVYVNPAVNATYKLVIKTSAEVEIYSEDNIPTPILSAEDMETISTDSPLLASLARTAAEIAAGVTPVNYAYAPGDLRRLADDVPGNLSASEVSDLFASTLESAGLVRQWEGDIEPVTLNIGSGGHFAAINDALTPLRRSVRLSQQITLHLLTGFVMAEEVHCINGVDLGWVRITAEDAEVTIQRSAITTELGDYIDLGGVSANTSKAAFMAVNGSTLPMIGALFAYDTSGSSDPERMGVMVWQNSYVRVEFGAGVKGADKHCLSCHHSVVIGEGSIWDEGGELCARVANMSRAHLRSASLTDCVGGANIAIANNSLVTLVDADLTGAASVGILANNSLVDAQGADVSNAGTDGLQSNNCAVVHFDNGVADSCGENGIHAVNGGIVYGGTVSVDGNTGPGVVAQLGGYISLSGGTAKSNGGSGDLVVLQGGIIVAPTTETTNGSGAPAYQNTNLGSAAPAQAFGEYGASGAIIGPAQQRTASATAIAAVGNAVNTAAKFAGRLIWDTTNNRMLRASGSAAADPWHVVDGSATVTPS